MGAWLALATILALPSGASAQLQATAEGRLEIMDYDDPEVAGLGRIELMTSRWTIGAPFAGRVTIGMWGGYAQGRVQGDDGTASELSGLLDTGLSLSVRANRALLNFTANLPTGTTTLTEGELALSGILASESLPFSMASWGSGGRVGGELAIDLSPGASTRLTLLGGYHMGQTYEPLAGGAFEYRPGDAVTARAALEQYIGAVTLNVAAAWWRYGNDQLFDENLFEPGDRLMVSGSVFFPTAGGGTGALWGSGATRAAGSALPGSLEGFEGIGGAPAQDLLRGGIGFRLPLAGMVLVPRGEGRLFRRDDGVSEGYLYGGNLALEITVIRLRSGGALQLVPSGGYRQGEVENRLGVPVGARYMQAAVRLRLVGVR